MSTEQSAAAGTRPAGLAWRGAVAGVLAGALALCVGQLVAAFSTPSASPVAAVGELSIDFTPPAVKNFAISAFGSHDKEVLVSGILVILAIATAIIGILAARRLILGMAGLGIFAVVGVIAAVTQPTAGPGAALPTLAAATAAGLALWYLTVAAARSAAARSAAARSAGARSAEARSAEAGSAAPGSAAAAGAATRVARSTGGEAAGPSQHPAARPGPAVGSTAQGSRAQGSAAQGAIVPDDAEADAPATATAGQAPALPRMTAADTPEGAADTPEGAADTQEQDPGAGAGSPPVSTGPVPVGAGWVPAGGSQPPGGTRPPGGTGQPPAQPPASTGSGGWAGGPPPRPGRRSFLVAGGLVAGSAAVALAVSRKELQSVSVAEVQKSLRIPAPSGRVPVLPPGADLKVPGLGPFVTPNSAFYRVDTAIVLPEIPPASWQLRIHGMVDREMVLTFDDLLHRPLIEDYVTLTCVSNPVGGPYISNARWVGVSLRSLLRQAGIKAGADQLFCTSFDGFTSGSPVQTAMDGRDAMLAVAMNGQPLPVEHGFPVRMVVPGLYGYVSACKWITDIEVTTYRSNVAYWAQRGWSQQAPIKTESRIDVPSGLSLVKPGKVAVAGVAWAQHKGIDAVHVRVDGSPWNQATLGAVPGIDTWRQWAWDWDAKPGRHVIESRATDKTGFTQTSLQESPEPNGASGYPQVSVTVGS
ncbi:MAG: molybdopterin-dependent oxidoreductase [Streptosporangiaceae bacterium]